MISLNKNTSIDYINSNQLAQDHPCVIEMIRRHYINEPSLPDVPYNLSENKDAYFIFNNGLVGITEPQEDILYLLKNKVTYYKLFSWPAWPSQCCLRGRRSSVLFI